MVQLQGLSAFDLIRIGNDLTETLAAIQYDPTHTTEVLGRLNVELEGLGLQVTESPVAGASSSEEAPKRAA
jgi:hypothetical protein